MQILSTGQGMIFTWNGNETSYMFSLGLLCFFSFVLSCFPFSLFLSSLHSLFRPLFLPIPPSFFLSSLLLSLLPSLLLLRFPSPAVLSQGGNRGISKLCRHAGSFLELWHRQAWSLCEVSSVTIHLWDCALRRCGMTQGWVYCVLRVPSGDHTSLLAQLSCVGPFKAKCYFFQRTSNFLQVSN